MKIAFWILLFCFISNSFVAQNVGVNVNGSAANNSAGLDVDFSDKGFLLPRMTTAERDAISSPALSLQIFNTSTNCLQVYIGSSWVNVVCDCMLPGMFSANSATGVTETQITANWSASATATSYRLDVDDNADFSSPLAGYDDLNVGNVVTYNITGLTCATTYYYRLRAVNSCGTSSNTNTITTSTSACVVYPVGSVHCIAGGATIQEVTNVSTGETWMDRNMGASQVATSSTDASAYGDLYQWGRFSDAHQCRTSSTTSTLSSSDTPGHSNYITTSGAPDDWRSPNNDLLWQGVGGTNNPCPTGYRLPTGTEFDAERLSWATNNAAGAFGSVLAFTVAGVRNAPGTVVNAGVDGWFWSSTVVGTRAEYLYFSAGSASVTNVERVHGLSVRCIKD